MKSCAKWGRTNNTSLHTNVHHVKNFCAQKKVLKLKYNGDMGIGHLWRKVVVKLPHKCNNCSSCAHHRITGLQLVFFLNEENDWSSCFSSLSKSYIPILQATKHESLRSFYVIDCHTKMGMPIKKKAMDTFFATLLESGK